MCCPHSPAVQLGRPRGGADGGDHISDHKGGVAGNYNRSRYEREVRAALALWADHLMSIVL
jgi:hypothetical protein